LGHARPRSEELGALVEAALSVDRGTGLGAEPTDAVAGLAVDASLVAVAAAIAGEGVCASVVLRDAAGRLFAASGAGLAGFAASLAEDPSTGGGAD
jgi:hypothetical protein